MNSSSTDKKSIRKFGAAAFVFFGILLGLALWRQKATVTFIFGILSFLGLCFLLLPGPLKPLYAGWLKVAHFIGIAMTTVILSLAYYLVITPAALLKRVFGGRPLPLVGDKNVITYWVPRAEGAQPKERFIKRY
jgi:peptidoglycan/LPS O-acetylase OafA/YrhL